MSHLNSQDWSKLWMPLAAELAKAVIGLIFGKTETKTRIVAIYGKGGMYESRNNNSGNAGIHNSSMGFRW